MLIAVDSGTDHDKTFLRSYTVRRTFWAQQLQHSVTLVGGATAPDHSVQCELLLLLLPRDKADLL